MTPEQQKFYDIKNTTDYKKVGADVDYKIIVDHAKKEVVLQFQESSSREDWKNNLDFLPWPLKLGDKTVWTTKGYATAYRSANDIPRNELITIWAAELNYKLCIRGWSFGSAMAKITARHMETFGWTIDELTTYGDVKCWLNPFYKAKNIIRQREYTTPNDGITWCVPFYNRDKKCQVGKFKLRALFKSEYHHTHYEDYDYSKWEEA